jgi:DNA-binding SARP family transcriptional activator
MTISDLLWSESPEEQARASLRTLLADLKEQYGSRFDDLLVVDRERVALGPAVRLEDWSVSSQRCPRGELFEGLDHIDPELDEWFRIERERQSGSSGAN